MRRLFKILLKNYWKKILLIIIFTFTLVYAQLDIIDLVSIISFLLKHDAYDQIVTFGMDIVVSVSLAVISLIFISYLSVSVVRDFSYDLRSKMLHIVTDFDTMDEMNKFPVSGLKTRFIRGVDTEESFLLYVFKKILLLVVISMEICFFLFFIFDELAVLLAIFLLISGLIIIFQLNRLSQIYFKVKALNGKLNRLFREKIVSSKLLKIQSKEQEKNKIFDDAADNSFNEGFRFQYKLNFIFYIIIFMVFVIIGFIFFSIFSIKIGEAELFQMTLILLYLIYLLSNFNGLMNFVAIYPLASTSAVRIGEVLVCEKSEVQKQLNQKIAIDFNGIKFDNVSLNVNGKDVLCDVSFEIARNSKTLIVGPVGAGKSILFYSLMGLYEIDSGKIFIDGYDASSIDASEKASLTTTESYIFRDNVFENIRFADTLISDADVSEAIHDSLFDELSNDLYYEINQNANNLNNDFKQRLAIARAIAHNRQYTIFDNSFSFIDSKSKQTIMNNILRKFSDKTLVFVDNSFDYLDVDNIIVMDNGRVVGQGKHDDLIKDCETYRKLYYQVKGDGNGI